MNKAFFAAAADAGLTLPPTTHPNDWVIMLGRGAGYRQGPLCRFTLGLRRRWPEW